MISKKTFFIKVKNTPLHFIIIKVVQKTLGKVLDNIKLKFFLKKKYFISDELFFRKLKFISTGLKSNKKDFCSDYLYFMEGLDKDSIINIFSDKKEILEYADDICDHKIEILDIKDTNVSMKTSIKANSIGGQGQNQHHPNYLRSKSSIKKSISNLSNSQNNKINSDYFLNYEYEPIDWHIDFKSGYRWNRETWYKNIKYGQPGKCTKKITKRPDE